MRKELKECSDEYDMISTLGVHPICKDDAKIIDKLHKILIGMEANVDLIEAIKKWKVSPDDDILGMLEQVELDLEQDIDGEMKKTIDFISYDGNDLSLKSLFSIRKADSYDMKGCKPVYKVLINDTENINVINGNIEVDFDDYIDRDLSIDDLKEKLSEFTHIRFL